MKTAFLESRCLSWSSVRSEYVSYVLQRCRQRVNYSPRNTDCGGNEGLRALPAWQDSCWWVTRWWCLGGGRFALLPCVACSEHGAVPSRPPYATHTHCWLSLRRGGIGKKKMLQNLDCTCTFELWSEEKKNPTEMQTYRYIAFDCVSRSVHVFSICHPCSRHSWVCLSVSFRLAEHQKDVGGKKTR